MPLISHLSSIISISKELEAEIKFISKKISFLKGQIILNINQRSDSLYFIEKGLVRGYYFNNGKEITNWFAQETEFATSFYSFISNKPSYEYIQALEDCEMVQLKNAELQNLYLKFSETERIGRIITENYYIKLEERLLNLQFKTAKERYQKLIEKWPSLLQRASLGQIASYLGITQETLSRIRSEV
ncbi:MAG: Crp/Fnr family transcriptional regulator [Bacteroidota bacterium]|nr:Crp/Fnr family transcriptional regulator [Bacteroidota bacterium]